MLCYAVLGCAVLCMLCCAGAVKIDRGKQRGNVCLHGETTVLGNMLCCGNVWSRARAGQAFSRLGMLLVKMQFCVRGFNTAGVTCFTSAFHVRLLGMARLDSEVHKIGGAFTSAFTSAGLGMPWLVKSGG